MNIAPAGKLTKVLPVILSLGLILLLALSGCGKTSPKPQAQQIVASTISAMDSVKSYDLNTFMTENYVVIGANPSMSADLWQWASHRQVDISKQEMYLTMDSRDAVNTYTFETYLTGGWEYYAQSSPFTYGTSNPWMKYKQSNTQWSDEVQLAPQIELLKSPDSIRLAGMDKVNGDDCYIIDLVPTAEAAADWVLSSQAQGSGPSLGWFRTSSERSKEIYIKAFQNGSVRFWIEKDNNLILKVNITLLFDGMPGNIVLGDTPLLVTEGQENSTNVGFDHILRDFNGQWEFSNYNTSMHIQVPQEALKATESGN